MRTYTLWLLLAVLLLTLVPGASAQEPTPIFTVEELQAMDPAGSYILMADLDLAGVDWTPLDLSGSLDGNGHALLNLTLSRLTQRQGTTFDGNWKEYPTRFCAMFGFVSGEIRNLKLLNVRGLIQADEPCFLAGLVGYLDGGTLSGCSVTGTLELRAFDRCFGVGGLVGHGIGQVEHCQADVTLICTDTDPKADEQFLGGIYAAGFIHATNCTVKIDGYASEHGYAHNGGVTGMCIRYPRSSREPVTVANNHVSGKITFFEEVASRRAYCEAIIGEVLVRKLDDSGNTHDFIRDERSDYSTELRPEACSDPVYQEVVEPGSCPEFGYSQYTCQTCGYTYRDHYTLPQLHSLGPFQVITPATAESEGLEEAHCAHCSLVFQQPIPCPTQPQTQPTVPVTVPQPEPEAVSRYLPAAVGGLALLGLLVLLALLLRPKKPGKYAK